MKKNPSNANVNLAHAQYSTDGKSQKKPLQYGKKVTARKIKWRKLTGTADRSQSS